MKQHCAECGGYGRKCHRVDAGMPDGAMARAALELDGGNAGNAGEARYLDGQLMPWLPCFLVVSPPVFSGRIWL
jgi:hypothetical protein